MRMFTTPFSPAARAARRRGRLARSAPPGPLLEVLSRRVNGPDTPLRKAKLLAVDIETTGLNPRTDLVLSMGWVPVDGLTIRLAGAGGCLVRPPSSKGRRAAGSQGARASGDVGQSAAVHGLTDDVVAAGLPLDEALDLLLTALPGRILLAHYAAIERDFLAAASRALHGIDLPLTTVDTLELQRLIVAGPEGAGFRPGKLRLGAAREHFGLPRYRAHDALTDALACAELYLAQVSQLGARGDLQLGRILD
ncbi:DNA polymerase-3 subunit epsilon [Kineosphaera limosa]|uniref:DNA polymerase III subunit epsilon n=1 Tax=Kineosphaera limosa NBRC 100340 TaxID=1184609 RepID=K6WFU1_9MICO|nr:exonuclease domain-containing protein [Kineosphaera limosa]NYE00265.1 DNA polymerase-3 subunit epsilon [Kineosphaera limosa]GAB98160.1 DNA polymerase III subunit epsilon [Kineosphaera limosa NBRC 100340]